MEKKIKVTASLIIFFAIQPVLNFVVPYLYKNYGNLYVFLGIILSALFVGFILYAIWYKDKAVKK